MKPRLPKMPRLKLRLPAVGAFAKPKMKFALPRIGSKRAPLYVGAGAAGLAALSALGWLVVWPMFRPAPPAVAVSSIPEKPPEKAVPRGGEEGKPDAGPTSAETAQEHPGRQKEAEAKSAQPDAAVAAANGPPSSEVEGLVRRLQDLEDRVAAGDAEAYAEMPRQIRAIAERFLAMPPETWAQNSNARLLTLYLLSGGSSSVGRRILSAHKFAPSEEALAKGAIAYLEGIDCAERDALLDIDPRGVDMALGAQIAFVQSILLASLDRSRAIAKLDLARLLAPGSLVEEAALRREAGLLSETSDFDKFAGLARQYWSRFRRSPYADNFLRQFVGAVARIAVLIKVEQWAQLDEFIDSLNAEKRRALYLVMARTAAVAGNSAFADLAAQRALALVGPESIERQRALLYRAAAEVGTIDFLQSANLLRDVSRARLPAGDWPLYDATATASAKIFRAPETNFTAPPPEAGDLSGGELARAESELREAGAALETARQSMERKSR